ncbi:CHASE4 domain-containing protein [Sphingomonas sp.]|jgi:signal transduction histidine kinase|uniref:CHASE4 domain-containing protein n=1 Tax=Sphingomonas sp. TaxID=28214 RepID=UPI002E36B040|nr:CHASE4 domain-containing protein [Sphingomonas sp.]HEX4693180.1 CHASE4 domain-containing protein [Sphingomonas sp.]
MPRGGAIARILKRARGASLGGKLLFILAGVGLVGSVALTLLLAAVITPSFNALERQSIDGHVERTRAALSDFATKVENSVRDYGDWNSSYDYIEHPTKAFEQESFSPLAMANLDVEGMAYLRPDMGLVIARWIDSRTSAENVDLRDAMVAAIRSTRLDAAMKGGHSGHFYLRLGNVVAAVGVAQVRRSDGSGTPRGYVVMVRRITSDQLGQLLQVKARLDPAAAVGPVVTTDREMLQIAVPVAGADGAAVAAASFAVPRDVSLLGRHMLWLAVLGSTILLAVVLAVLSRMIARLVLKPLGVVEGHMQRVRDSGSLSVLPEDAKRQDEIASLGRSFNSMLVQLKDLREQVEVQSFALGRSESAVAVMHNVRNALNPVSTILSAGIGQAAPVDRALIERSLAELIASDATPDRRQKLVSFVAAAFDAEDKQRDDRRDQLQVGRDAMRQVLEIIGAQQQLAHERPPLEQCDATQIIAQNATIARHSGDGSSIAFNFPAKSHPVMANRVLLSQVVGNLFSNAAEAILASGGSGSINVTIVETGQGTVEIAIQDSGEGFDAGNAPQLFQRGFSTRAHKSGGLGLHWCANSMTAMEGSLSLESEGAGMGAVARLVLRAPRAQPEKTDLAA